MSKGESLPASQNLTLSRAVWKMLADHHLHHLRVVLDTDEEFREEEDFSLIGGEAPGDISFEEYLKDWPG